MSNKNKQIRQSFTLEFKQSAAKLVNEKGYSHQQAADSLGVSSSALGRWVRVERGFLAASPTKKKYVIYCNKMNWPVYVMKLQLMD